jgi:hypothetical protein
MFLRSTASETPFIGGSGAGAPLASGRPSP